MSFSGEIKEEISRHVPVKSHCLRTEIAAIIQFSGIVCSTKGKETVLVETENVGLAKKYLQLLKKAYDIQANLEIKKRLAGRNHLYSISVSAPEDAERLIRDAILGETEDGKHTQFGQVCCRRAFIRGTFLAAGSMSDPGKSYHFEIVCRTEAQAKQLQLLIQTFEIQAKVAGRKNKYIVYLKDSAEIVDILNVMEAHKALMELENIRILKDMRNSANRQYNCDSANINKMVQAAARQLEDIRYIEKNLGFEHLTKSLREMALTRLEYPDVSLLELGTYLDPPVGKSGVNHRLRKLGEIAQELREQEI